MSHPFGPNGKEVDEICLVGFSCDCEDNFKFIREIYEVKRK